MVYLPLWKIWTSVGIIIPYMFQTTNQIKNRGLSGDMPSLEIQEFAMENGHGNQMEFIYKCFHGTVELPGGKQESSWLIGGCSGENLLKF